MIQSFNQKQSLFGCLRIALAFIIFGLAYAFFMFITQRVNHSFELHLPNTLLAWIPAVCLVLIMISGYQRWKNGQGHFTMAESSIPDNSDTGLLNWHVYQKDRTSNATMNYLLTTLFLAGPIQLMQAYDHFQSRIPDEHGLETKLINLLTHLKQIDQWQDFNAHQGHERELIFLIKMGEVDYSPHKGKIRASATNKKA